MMFSPPLTASHQDQSNIPFRLSAITDTHLALHAHETACPLCQSHALTPFLFRDHVPVLMNRVSSSRHEAQQIPRGTIDLTVCRTCGFVFNRAFESQSLYTGQYDNTQAYAPMFEAYLDTVVASLLTDHNLHHCRILEVGCGNGLFLRKLVEAGEGIQGYGFDPSYTGPKTLLDGRLHFEQRYYDTTWTLPVDVVICRHVIEHIPDPLAFLRTLRHALHHAPKARIFIETPTIAWILHNKVLWDIYYEHCSYFCAETLALACERAGFHVEHITHVFGGQYLWCEATSSANQEYPSSGRDTGRMLSLAHAFHLHEQRLLVHWQQTIQELAQEGRVALLGAAGKGVTCANMVDPDGSRISCLVDLNPRKQGCYLPGSGHPIISYEEIQHYGVRNAVLMNPNYKSDTLALLHHHQIELRLVDLHEEEYGISASPRLKSEHEQLLAPLVATLEEARQAGRTVVFTNGVLDLLHAGHIQFLRYAKSLGDILVVAVDNDHSARQLKGPGRPIHSEHDRLLLIASLDMVDSAFLFDGDTLSTLVRLLRPHIYVKGAEYAGQASPAADALQEIAGTWVIAPPIEETLHTSAIIERILSLASGA